MLDAVKEGDGERLMRLYKAYAHSHAYSTFLLTLQVNAYLTPRTKLSLFSTFFLCLLLHLDLYILELN